MKRLVFDIETNGFLQDVSRLWIVAFRDLDTGEEAHFLEGDFGWMKLLSEAELIVGHNILGYDFLVLEKLFNFKRPKKAEILDTLILSMVLDYKRFSSNSHSLDSWGQALGYPKIQFDDFSQYSHEMLVYCKRDVSLNVKVFNVLSKEMAEGIAVSANLRKYIEAEHSAANWIGQAELHGWPFDVSRAEELYEELASVVDDTETALSKVLGLKTVAVDKAKGEVPFKEPGWTKDGFYKKHTAEWFGVDPISGYEGEERMIEGPYSRVEFVPLELSSPNDVKIFLYRHGWIPTEWNWKLNEMTLKKEKTSAKITEDSLELLGGEGRRYTQYTSAKSRFNILKTWLQNVNNGNLHGSCFLIGTPSMRARHSIIVNVPNTDAPWGKEMRQLFACKPGWKIVGCDSKGNQARGLAHYLESPEFTHQLLEGDIHQYNADILTKVLKEMNIDHVVPRGVAKRILYAFLFGASGGKLWSYIFGDLNEKKGKILKNGFSTAVPGFKELVDRLDRIYGSTSKKGNGYIRSLVGNKIYVDSWHKLLVYLLQSCEKITCVMAIDVFMKSLERESIPYQPLVFMHDEVQLMVPEEHAERVAELGREAFAEGPRQVGVTIMGGDSRVGSNWYETH